MRLALAILAALLVPVAALGGGGAYRLGPTKTCLASKKVLLTSARPAADLARFGVTGVIDFNFGLDPGVGDPPQGLIFFTRSAAAAKKARAGIVRYAEKLAKAAIPRDFLRLERNVLLLWLIPAQRPSQARTIATCLTRSV